MSKNNDPDKICLIEEYSKGFNRLTKEEQDETRKKLISHIAKMREIIGDTPSNKNHMKKNIK